MVAIHDGIPSRAKECLDRPGMDYGSSRPETPAARSEALEALGDPRGAAESLELSLGFFAPETPVLSIECIYRAGRAWEAAGNAPRAVANYGRFLSYWGKSDWVIPEIEDARLRLHRLKTHTSTSL